MNDILIQKETEMEWITYIPDFNNNREETAEKQITVEILPLTVRESRRVAGAITAKRVKGGSFKTNQSELSLKVLGSHIRNIKNLRHKDKEVTTFDDLLDTPFVELGDELEAAMQNSSILDEGSAKNLKSQSSGALEKIQVLGTAGTVSPPGND